MDAVTLSNLCILLVVANVGNAAWLSLCLLLKSKYRVMTAHTANDALCILKNKQHGVDLVMVNIGLPDLCSFELIKIIDEQIQLAVVMICDSHNQHTMLKGSSSGALGAYVYPMSSEDLKDLWRFPALKRQMIMLGESTRKAVQQSKKKKINGGSVGQSSECMQLSDVKYLIPLGIQQFNLAKAMFAVGAHRVYAPGVTCNWELVERSELFRAHLQQQFGVLPLSAIASPQRMNTDADDEEMLDEPKEGSFLARYLEHPYSREQLKRVVKVAMLKWMGKPRALMEMPPLQPPPSEVPLVSLPVSLARYIETFIHTMNASKVVPDGDGTPEIMHQLASEVGSTGPSGSSELLGGGEELDLDSVDTDDVYDAVKELWDDSF